MSWSIDFTRSGGFTGRTVSLYVSSSGQLTAFDPEKNLVVRTDYAADELAGIRQLLQAVCPFPAGRKPAGCPDCFLYTLDVQMDGQTYSTRATDNDLAGLGPLIDALGKLLDKWLSAPP